MADKSSFTAEEWARIVGSPILAGMVGALAGTGQPCLGQGKSMASASALIDAKKDAKSSQLINAVLEELETAHGRAMGRDAFRGTLTARTPSGMRLETNKALEAVFQLLDEKAGPEGATFKNLLNRMIARVSLIESGGSYLLAVKQPDANTDDRDA